MSQLPFILTVGQLAQRSGVAVSALHFYEAKGLIASTRTTGNQRRYTRDTLRRVAFIRFAQRVGVPLAKIRDALASLPEQRTPTRADWARLSASWRAELDARIDALQRLRDDLTDCIGCGCLSLERCALSNPDDVLGETGPGPRRLLAPTTGSAGGCVPAQPDGCHPGAGPAGLTVGTGCARAGGGDVAPPPAAGRVDGPDPLHRAGSAS